MQANFITSSKKLILGSQSPRRRELLLSLGFSFETVFIDSEETVNKSLKPFQIAEDIALQKAKLFTINSNEILVTADTIVVLNNTILGKPNSYSEAKKMLEELSGKSHFVITGICIKTDAELELFHESTEVKFNLLSTDMIDYYLTNFKYSDKAGSYGIQDWIGKVGIDYIKGCYYNVMGLPTSKLFPKLLEKLK